jgi:hypothetical protein
LLTADRIADILEVCFDAGIDTLMTPYSPKHPKLIDAVTDAEDETGPAAQLQRARSKQSVERKA